MTASNASNSTGSIGSTQPNIRELTTKFAQSGQLQAIYCRPARGIMCVQTDCVTAIAGRGLKNDRASLTVSRNTLSLNLPRSNRPVSNRQVTLIQAEHIAVISALMNKTIDPAILRRNLVVSGINLLAAKSLFKDQPMHLIINDVILEITGPCEPCSKMEASIGIGAYNAMRGHGGVNAKVIMGGKLKPGDIVMCRVATPFNTLQKSLF